MENTVFDASLQALCSQGPMFLWLSVTQMRKEDNETMTKGPTFPRSQGLGLSVSHVQPGIMDWEHVVLGLLVRSRI